MTMALFQKKQINITKRTIKEEGAIGSERIDQLSEFA